MKTTVVASLFSLFTTVVVQASSDSVGVFHRPERVVVLVNEGARSTRLSQMMQTLGLPDRTQLISSDSSVKIECGRNDQAASCTFRFLPSKSVVIGEKFVEAKVFLADLKIEALNDFVIEFESAMQDRFVMQVSSGIVHFIASKQGAVNSR